MKAFLIGSGLLAASLTVLFFVSGQAVSENSASASHSVSVESNHPLAMTHQELKQAYENFNKGDIDRVQKDLNAASQWLQQTSVSDNTKTKDEAAALVKEIQALQQKISHPSAGHEGAIARIWHRSSALVDHEIQHMTKSWSDVSTANKTMKYLLNAKLHFNYAEHDLFTSHDSDNANKELSYTITYLDEADKIAIPRVRQQIASIKKDIQALASSHANAHEQQNIINALDMASASIHQASQSAVPLIQARLKSLAKEIGSLKNDIAMLEYKQQYDAILEKLRKLETEL
ncbi:MAG TPA: hypothetical protein DDW45_06720 [Gammaproteobacteria bacterium]|nr:hypothetical protein [Gammaproteobacteria bacterium]